MFLSKITLVVHDYDEAIQFYTSKMGFELIEDTALSETKRWVVLKVGHGNCQLLLARAATEQQTAAVGNQTGGRVGFFLGVEDFDSYWLRLVQQGVSVVREPTEEVYGKVGVVADLYHNLWDIISA